MCWTITLEDCSNHSNYCESKCQQKNAVQQQTVILICEKNLVKVRKIENTVEGKHANNMIDTHYRGLWSWNMLRDSWDIFCFRGRLGLQDVLRLDHFQIAVLRGRVAVFERDQDGPAVLPGEPLLCLQGGIGAGRVGIQVVLEQIRLDRWRGHRKRHEERKDGAKCWRDEFTHYLKQSQTYLTWDCHDDWLTFSLVQLVKPSEKIQIIWLISYSVAQLTAIISKS